MKYDKTTKNNTTYFNSATSMNTNTTGQKAHMIIIGLKSYIELFHIRHQNYISLDHNVAW